MKRQLYLLIIFAAAFANSCIIDYNDSRLTIVNRSKTKISVIEHNGTDPYAYDNNVAYYTSDQGLIDTNSSKEISKSGLKNAWTQYINEAKDKKLRLYFFEIDTLKKYDNVYSMRQLVEFEKYAKLNIYTEQELNKMGWQVLYP